jgi:hypothetical protein
VDVCASKGLELIGLESLTQLDAVQDFVGNLGILCFFRNYSIRTQYSFTILGLSSNFLMSAVKTAGAEGSNWLGDLASAFLPPADSGQDGSCLGLGAVGLTGISCDMVSNFVCQAPDPPDITPFPSIRLHKHNEMIKIPLTQTNYLQNSDIFQSLLPIEDGEHFLLCTTFF